MAGLASAVLALIILVTSMSASAGDFFTGFRMDGETQYHAYLGLRMKLPFAFSGFETHAQLFTSAQSYEYDTDDQEIEADVQNLTPSLVVSRSLGGGPWTILALVGPELRWKHEDGFRNDSDREFDVGVMLQMESMYWQETRNLHAMVSYASLDDFFFGRVRAKLQTYSPETGCCPIFAGLDIAGMGNDDFRAVQVGPVVEVPVAGFFLLFRAGYQNDSSFGSGGYGGLEIYTQF